MRTSNTSPTAADLPHDAHEHFLSMLPGIRHMATFAFRHLPRERREEAVQDVEGYAWATYARLVALGKQDLAYPTPLARIGIQQFHDDRQLGTAQNLREVTSRRCQRANGLRVQSLHRWDASAGRWGEVVVEDRRARPDEIAATRLDFRAWLDSLPSRKRRVAETLASGERPSVVAEQFGLSRGRISQLRRELAQAWRTFQGELSPPSGAEPAAA